MKRTSYAPLILLAIAQFAVSSDVNIVGMAANSLTNQLGGSMPDIQLANMMFGLVAGIFMISGGMIGLLIGWRANFRLGTLLILAGEIIMVCAVDMTIFTWVGRVCVGIGASFLIPSVLGLVPALYHGQQRVFAFGCVAAGAGAATLTPLILGAVLDFFGFRFAFAILGVLFLLITLFSGVIPKTDAPRKFAFSKKSQSDSVLGSQIASTKPLSFDVIGFAFTTLGFFCLLVGLSYASTWGLIDPLPRAPFTLFGISPTLPAIALGLAALILLVIIERVRERQGKSVLIPGTFINTAGARNGLIAVALPFFVAGSYNIAVIPYLQMATGTTALQTGILYAFVGVPMIILSMGVPKLFPRVSPRRIICWGYLITGLGPIVIALSFSSNFILFGTAFGMLLTGIGSGLICAHASNSVTRAIGEKDAQQSGGIQGTARDLSNSLAVALLGTLLLLSINGVFGFNITQSEALSDEAKSAFTATDISFSSDAVFNASAQKTIELTPDQSASVLEIYHQSRLEANQLSLIVLGLIIISSLAFSRRLPCTPNTDGPQSKLEPID